MKMLMCGKILLFALIVCAVYVFVVYNIQRSLIFLPFKKYVAPHPPFVENVLTMKDGTEVMTWYAEGDKQKPVFLYFHGNAFQLAYYTEPLEPLIEQGYGVLMMEYRNFGNTKGKTLQQDIFSDAAGAFDWLKAQGYPEIIVYGYSYGAAVASGLTSLRPVDKLILTAPFSSLHKLVKEKPVPLAGWLLTDHYPSEEYLAQYHNPLLIIHGTKDRLIPYHHGQQLYEAAASADKKFVLVEGASHQPIYFDKLNIPAIFEWLKEHNL